MRQLYQIGGLYVWQNQTDENAWLNGKECIVIGPLEHFKDINGGYYCGHPTDTLDDGDMMMAEAGDLRPKKPPNGEKSIWEMFNEPKVLHLELEDV